MIEQDTIRLLRECDAGIKMGVASINSVSEYVSNADLKRCLVSCKEDHESLRSDLEKQLNRYHDEGKEPNLMAKSMSWIKTNAKLVMKESDNTIADLITDGCNMGVKSLSRYLNQYKAADEGSKDIAKRLINMEEQLVTDMKRFL